MVKKINLGLLKSYHSCIDWIEREEGFLKEPIELNEKSKDELEAADGLISFFLHIYDSVVNDKEDIDVISVYMLDCLFYSLLSDIRERLHLLCISYLNKWDIVTKKLQKLGIKDHSKIEFIRLCFTLFDAGTNLYYDAKKPIRVRDEISREPKLDNEYLVEVLKIVANYIWLYSQGRRKIPSDEAFSEVKNYANSYNPYLFGGYINIKLKLYDSYRNNAYILTNLEIKNLNYICEEGKLEFNKGYYYLLLARYYNLIGNFNDAKSKCDLALIYTTRYCEKNGKRIYDISNLRNEILRNISWQKKFKEVELLANAFKDIQKEFYSLIGFLIAVITIPLSILNLFDRAGSEIKDFWLVVLMGAFVILGILIAVVLVIRIPVAREKYLNYKILRSIKRGR